MSWLIFSIIIVVSAYLGDASIYKTKSIRKWLPYVFRAFLVVALSYLIGFGSQSGQDHVAYVYFYDGNYVSSFSFADTFDLGSKFGWSEPGFVAISKLIKLLGFGEAGYFFIISLITNAFMVAVFYRFRVPALVFVIFITSIYYNQQMNIVRQMLAVSFFLYSLKYIETHQVSRYVVSILITALFHFSAIFLLVLVPFAMKKQNLTQKELYMPFLVVWIISVLFALGGGSLDIGSLFGDFNLYHKYLTNEDMIGSKASFNLFFNFFALLYFLLFKREKIGIYDIIFLLGCIVLNFSVPLNNLLRFSYYFTPIYCAYIPTMLLQSADNKNQYAKPVFWVTSIYYCSVLILSYIMNPAQIMGSEMYDWSEFFR